MSLLERASSSVRARITAVAVLFVLSVTTVGSVVIVLMISHTVTHSLIDSATQDAIAVDAELAGGASPQQVSRTGRSDMLIQLLDRNGQVLAADGPGGEAGLRVPLLTAPGVSSTLTVGGAADRFTVVARQARSAGPVGLIIIGRATEQRDETRAETAGVLAATVPVVVGILGVVVWVSVGRALRPVELMREEADQITVAHLRRRLPVPDGVDEIPRLARTLNEMLDRIDEGHRRQRQFVSDASHELRSPLAVIRQSAEVAAAYPARVQVAELAGDVLAESTRLEQLVTAMLLLARLEDSLETSSVVLDLDDVVLEEVARRPAPEGVEVDVEEVGSARVAAHRVLLAQLIGNLLDNAARHASGRIRVSVGTEDDAAAGPLAVLRVEDDGSGIPEAERARIFERFVRLDEARTRDEGGSGLGLAIVSRIAEGLGGSVQAGSSELGGAAMVVRLPLAQ